MKTEELAREVIARLKGEGKTLATAESCTDKLSCLHGAGCGGV